MKKTASHITITTLSVLFCLLNITVAYGQMPVCSSTGGLIYFISNTINMYDPTLPIGPGNPTVNTIAPPAGAGCLAISQNINTLNPTPTFYTIAGSGTYYYYNGTNWVNTGHSAGSPSAVNIGAGGGYIYNLVGGTGEVYRYDGTGNATLLVTISSFAAGGPFDLAADCQGNFYILRIATTGYLQKYDKYGTLIQSWTISGPPSATAGGGMGIIGNTVFFHNTSGLWSGPIGATNVNFTQIGPPTVFSPSDFATCPLGNIGVAKASIDTGYYCGPGTPPVSVSVTGAAPYTWTVLSGPAVINGGGSTVTITASGLSKIQVSADGVTDCGGPGKDTVTIIVPTAIVNAGADDTTYGCAVYLDTLAGSLTGTTAGVTYTIAWSPTGTINSGTTTIKPVVAPTGSPTVYTMTVTTPSNQGGCKWTDDMTMTAVDASVGKADFTNEIHWGCTSDTILINNTSGVAFGKPEYKWNWGDFSKIDTGKNPVHVYYAQKNYTIALTMSNNLCFDTISHPVDVQHPLIATITTKDDRLCPGDTILFDGDKSTITKQPGTYFWDFGHGETSTLVSTAHTFKTPGAQHIRLIVTDSLGCKDTTEKTLEEIVALPFIDAGPSDTTICDGDIIFLPLGISVRGTDYLWQDGSIEPKHSVTKAGIYIVKLSNECGSDYDTINVKTKNCKLWFPSGFSPNGDGRNDIAKLLGSSVGITDYELAIYNRYGDRVFFTEDLEAGWDGTYKNVPQQLGTYYYYIKYTYGGSAYKMKGDIILVR